MRALSVAVVLLAHGCGSPCSSACADLADRCPSLGAWVDSGSCESQCDAAPDGCPRCLGAMRCADPLCQACN